MDRSPNRVTRGPDGRYLIPRWDDRENLLMGMDFGTRMDVLEGVLVAARARLARRNRSQEKRAYAAYVALEVLHALMTRQRLSWERGLRLVHPDVLSPEFQDVDLPRAVAQLRRTLKRRLAGGAQFVVNHDLHRHVLRLLARGQFNWTEAGLEATVQQVERRHPVVLENGCRYDHQSVSYTLAYYGVGTPHRSRFHRGYLVNLQHLEDLLHLLAEEGTIDMTKVGWMQGRYRFRDGIMVV